MLGSPLFLFCLTMGAGDIIACNVLFLPARASSCFVLFFVLSCFLCSFGFWCVASLLWVSVLVGLVSVLLVCLGCFCSYCCFGF